MAISRVSKAIVYSVFTVGAGLIIYWYLYKDGWLTNPYYHLNDPDIINLFLAILEPLIVLAAIVYWLNRRPWFYRLLFVSFILQLAIVLGFAALIILFALTWQPRMM